MSDSRPQKDKAELSHHAKTSMKEVLQKWSDPEHGEDVTLGWDWRQKVRPYLRAGDIRGMRQAALPSVQHQVIELAHSAKNENVRLQASQLILAQEGHGPIQRTEVGIEYRQMPPDQLRAIMIAKFLRLMQLNPALDIPALLAEAKSRIAQNANGEAQPEFTTIAVTAEPTS